MKLDWKIAAAAGLISAAAIILTGGAVIGVAASVAGTAIGIVGAVLKVASTAATLSTLAGAAILVAKGSSSPTLQPATVMSRHISPENYKSSSLAKTEKLGPKFRLAHDNVRNGATGLQNRPSSPSAAPGFHIGSGRN